MFTTTGICVGVTLTVAIGVGVDVGSFVGIGVQQGIGVKVGAGVLNIGSVSLGFRIGGSVPESASCGLSVDAGGTTTGGSETGGGGGECSLRSWWLSSCP